MSKENVLVLGAGVYQLPLIRAVQACGCKAIVASIPGDYPGFALADEALFVDTRDAEALLAVANERRIDAAVTAGTDVAVASIGRLCDELGLAGVSKRTAEMSTNKIAMKRAFEAGNVSTAEFKVMDVDCGIGACKRVSADIGYPVIFKAVDSSGSRGITKAFSADDVQRAYDNVLAITREREFLIERCLTGVEFGMQLFVQGGTLSLYMPHGDYLFEGRNTAVPFGHYAPYGTDELVEQARLASERLVSALEIDTAAVNVDAIYCDGIAYIIEAGARVGATGLAELVSARYGFDYYKAIVESALGQHVEVPRERKDSYPVGMLMGSDRNGTVVHVEVPESLDSHVIECSIDCSPGDSIEKFDIGPNRIGQVIASAESFETAERAVFETLDSVSIELDSGEPVGLVRGVRQP